MGRRQAAGQPLQSHYRRWRHRGAQPLSCNLHQPLAGAVDRRLNADECSDGFMYNVYNLSQNHRITTMIGKAKKLAQDRTSTNFQAQQ